MEVAKVAKALDVIRLVFGDMALSVFVENLNEAKDRNNDLSEKELIMIINEVLDCLKDEDGKKFKSDEIEEFQIHGEQYVSIFEKKITQAVLSLENIESRIAWIQVDETKDEIDLQDIISSDISDFTKAKIYEYLLNGNNPKISMATDKLWKIARFLPLQHRVQAAFDCMDPEDVPIENYDNIGPITDIYT